MRSCNIGFLGRNIPEVCYTGDKQLLNNYRFMHKFNKLLSV